MVTKSMNIYYLIKALMCLGLLAQGVGVGVYCMFAIGFLVLSIRSHSDSPIGIFFPLFCLFLFFLVVGSFYFIARLLGVVPKKLKRRGVDILIAMVTLLPPGLVGVYGTVFSPTMDVLVFYGGFMVVNMSVVCLVVFQEFYKFMFRDEL